MRFPHLNSYESRGYFASLPNKRRITHDDLNATIDESFDAPGSLVYLQGMTKEAIYNWPERLQSRASDSSDKPPKQRRRAVTDLFKRNRLSDDQQIAQYDAGRDVGRDYYNALLRPDPAGMSHYARLQASEGRTFIPKGTGSSS